MAQVYGGRWENLRSLGEGGQAHTFLVRDNKEEGQTQYVLKRLLNPSRNLERLKREVEALRNLPHENIVRLIDFDLDNERPYIVTEYCEGGSLDRAERFWSNSPIAALKIFQQVCEGVAHAHNQNVIHRDIKPGNIFLRTADGPAVVGDFGLCLFQDQQTRLTAIDEGIGSVRFIAPELEDGRLEQVTKRCDTYSLGKLLYWLLKGNVFAREKHRDILWDLKGEKIPHPGGFIHWEKPYLEHINLLIDVMLRTEPDERIDVSLLPTKIRQLAWLIEHEINPTNYDVQQKCYYCHQGYYRLLGDQSDYKIPIKGFQEVDRYIVRIWICDNCGNTQMFRIDKQGKEPAWLGRNPQPSEL